MNRPGQHVLVTLRKMIASGELIAGERLGEVATADSLGVSRMPVRMAFRELEQEGLLVKLGARGYTVRAFRPEDINGAVEVRGVLEGLAARQAAERGLSAAHRLALRSCIDVGDGLMIKGHLTEDDVVAYHDMNIRFHRIIVAASGNPAIAEALARNNHLPFASVNALVIDRGQLDREYRRLNYAHLQHHAVVDALEAGHGARAEAIMREHAHAVLNYTDLFRSSDTVESRLTVIRRP